MTREEIVEKIIEKRSRQFDLPGRELDVINSVNDWCAIAGRYLFEETRRGLLKPTRENFEDSLIKSAAVIIAALEYCDQMEKKGCFLNSD